MRSDDAIARAISSWMRNTSLADRSYVCVHSRSPFDPLTSSATTFS